MALVDITIESQERIKILTNVPFTHPFQFNKFDLFYFQNICTKPTYSQSLSAVVSQFSIAVPEVKNWNILPRKGVYEIHMY